MKKLTRIIVRRFWGACAFLVISLAVLVAIGRELSPRLDRYKDDLANYVGETLDVDVSIDSLAFDWSGLSPELSLQEVNLHNEDGQVVMSMGQAQLKLNLIRSLFNLTLALDEITASKVGLHFSQDENGTWGFAGVPWETSSNENFNIDDPLDIFLLIGSVDFEEVQFDLSYRSGEKNRLKLRNLNFENSRDFHRIRASIVIEDDQFIYDSSREVVAAILEFRGDPRNLSDFSAKGYAKFIDVDVAKVTAALPGQWHSDEPLWNDRFMTAETWFDIFSGGELLFRGRLDVDKDENSFENEANLSFNVPTALGANFTGRVTRNGYWSVSVRDGIVDWQNFQTPPVNIELSSVSRSLQYPNALSLNVSAEKILLDDWVKALGHAGVVKGWGVNALDTLNPQGQMQNIKARINLPTKANTELINIVEMRANFDEVALESWRGAPAASNLSGFTGFLFTTENKLKGWVEMNTAGDMAIHFPTLYENAMEFDSVLGRVDWNVDLDEKHVDVYSSLLSINSDDGAARGYFNLSIPLEEEAGNEELILQIGLRDSYVKNYQKYTPSRLPKELWDWLDSSLNSNDGSGSKGEISAGGFIYRGGLTAKGQENSAVQLFLEVEDSNVFYHPDWPMLKNAKGVLWVDQVAVHAEIEKARFLEGDVSNLVIDIDNDIDAGEMILTIDGNFDGDANDGLTLLQSDVFEPVIKGNFDQWIMTGPIHADVELLVPIKTKVAKQKQKILVDLNSVQLAMNNINANFNSINGSLYYDDELGLLGSGLLGLFLGEPIKVSLADDKSTNAMLINAMGSNRVDRLREWAGLNFLSFANGESDFLVDVKVPYDSLSSWPEINIRSDLVGVNTDLPGEWGKQVEERRPLDVTATLGSINNYYHVNYDQVLFGNFHISGKSLKRAVISTTPNAPLPTRSQFDFRGEMEKLDFEAWQNFYTQHLSSLSTAGLSSADHNSASSLPLVFDLAVDQFSMFDFVVEDLALDAELEQGLIDVQLESEKIVGNVGLNLSEAAPIEVRLDRLVLPKNEKTPPSWRDVFYPSTSSGDALAKVDPKEIPAVNFSANELHYGDESLGAWSFELRPNSQGLAVSNILANFEQGQVLGFLGNEGAALQWSKTEQGQETWVQGRVSSSDMAALIEQWDQPELLQSENANFDFTLRWPGAPTSMSTSRLDGDIAVLMEQGSFFRIENESTPGAALQLISILNFDTWIRRLRLDFSDLGRRGTPFNRLEGLLEFNDGIVNLNRPLVMETQSGEFELTGIIDLQTNEIDTHLTATLPMGGNLTFLTALAAGLPAAAGVWVVSKIFDEQIDKVSTLNYKIGGTLQEPTIEFDSLFDSESVASP